MGRRVGPDQADEVASETFTRAFASRRSFRPIHEDARPWLLGIATNVREATGGRSSAAWPALAGWKTRPPGESPDLFELDLPEALAALPQADREVLFLLAWADLTYERIAAALEVPVGTVRSRINRARRKLGAVLIAALEDESGSEVMSSIDEPGAGRLSLGGVRRGPSPGGGSASASHRRGAKPTPVTRATPSGEGNPMKSHSVTGGGGTWLHVPETGIQTGGRSCSSTASPSAGSPGIGS